MRKSLFEVDDIVMYQGKKYTIIEVDNESNTEPIITIIRKSETIKV